MITMNVRGRSFKVILLFIASAVLVLALGIWGGKRSHARSVEKAATQHFTNHGTKKHKKDIQCVMFLQDTQYDGSPTGPVETWMCEEEEEVTVSTAGRSRKVKRSKMKKLRNFDDFATEYAKVLKSGETVLTIPEADVNNEEIEINIRSGNNERVSVSARTGLDGEDEEKGQHRGQRNRNLAIVEGTKTVLVLRIKGPDSSTPASAGVLSDAIFGTAGDAVNLASQYEACSHGKLRFVPATHPTNPDVVNGVYEVDISNDPDFLAAGGTIFGAVHDTVRQAAIATAENELGNLPGQFDHVMLCIPPGTVGSWAAYAYVNHWMSVFNTNWCTYPTAQVHEIGHNLELAHSGEGSDSYGDQSSMLGYSYSQPDGPKMCFNGAKSYQLGWYSDREITIDPLSSQWNNVQLVGVAEYDYTSADQVVVAKIEAGTDDYYVAFNRMIGANSGTLEGRDMVMVTRQGFGYSTSLLVAKLEVGGEFPIENFKSTGETVIVSVNKVDTSVSPGYADVSIFVYVAPTISPAPTPAPFDCPNGSRFGCFVTTDQYPQETSWTLTRNGLPYMQEDGWSDRDTEHSREECIPPGSYMFTIYDVYGDGNCCSFGNGKYTLMLDYEVIKSRDGDFGSSDSFNFVVGNMEPTVRPTLSPTQEPTTTPLVRIIETNADSYVHSGKTANNYGTSQDLWVKKGSRTSVMKFDLSKLLDATSVVLRLHVSNPVTGPLWDVVVKRLAEEPTWDEGSVTWASLTNDVEMTGATFVVTTDDINTWVEVDVSDLVIGTSSTTLNLLLEVSTGSNSKLLFSSREAGDGTLAPKLVVSSLDPNSTPSPSRFPTTSPSKNPTRSPSKNPTLSPSKSPIVAGNLDPTGSPTVSASQRPTNNPLVLIIEPNADSYVHGGKTSNNYGSNQDLWVKKGSRKSVMKFDLSELLDATSAVLRLHISDLAIGPSWDVVVKRLSEDPAWDEGTVTWDSLTNSVEMTGETFVVTMEEMNTWVEVDVSDLVVGTLSTTLNLLLEVSTGSSSKLLFSSREAGDGTLAPKLIVSIPDASAPVTAAPHLSPTRSPTIISTLSPSRGPTTSPTVTTTTNFPTTGVTAAPVASPSSSQTTHLFKTTADVSIRSGSWSTNKYGSKTSVNLVDEDSFTRKILLKFELGQEIQSSAPNVEAKLRLYVTNVLNDASRTIAVRRVTSTPEWEESSVTWDNNGAIIQQTASNNLYVLNSDAGTWVEVEVGDLVASKAASGGGTLELMLEIISPKSRTATCVFMSKEGNIELSPELVVTTETSSGSDLTAAPTSAPTFNPTTAVLTPNPTLVATTASPTANQSLSESTYHEFENIADVSIRSGDKANSKYGAQTTLNLMDHTYTRKILLRFNLAQEIPSSATSLSGKLHLYPSNMNSDPSRTIRVSQVEATPDWDESSVTWANFNSTSSVERVGINNLVVYQEDVGTWVEVEIGDLVASKAAEGGGILVLMLEIVSGSSGGNKCIFVSKEGDSALAPKLVVTTGEV